MTENEMKDEERAAYEVFQQAARELAEADRALNDAKDRFQQAVNGLLPFALGEKK